MKFGIIFANAGPLGEPEVTTGLGVDRMVIPPLGSDLETLRKTIGDFADWVIAKAS